MFDSHHDQRIAKILHVLNSDLLLHAECYFASGTAIARSLAEYRESVNMDVILKHSYQYCVVM